MTALREAALAAIAAQLTAQIPTATVERAMRGPPDIDKDSLPLLNVVGGDLTADETAEPGATHYTLSVSIAGYVRARTGLLAEQAMSDMQAQVTAALAGWEPAVDGIGNTQEQGADFRLYSTDESEPPAGEFIAQFTILLIAATGNPYTA